MLYFFFFLGCFGTVEDGIPEVSQYPRWCLRTLKVGGLPLQGGKLHSYLIPMGKDVSFYSDLLIYQLPPWVSSRSYWAMYFHVNGAPFFRQKLAPSAQWNVTIFPQVLVLEISRFFSFGFSSFFINFQQTKSWPKTGGVGSGENIFALVFLNFVFDI